MKRILSIILAAVLLCALAVPSLAADDSLLFHLKLEDGAFDKDEVGKSQVTVYGTLEAVEGKVGGAAYFDGIETAIWVETPYEPQQQLTVSMWAYTEFFNGLLGLVVAPWVDTNDICIEITADGKLQNNVKSEGWNADTYSEPVLVEGEWAFLTIVYDAVNKRTETYVNGELSGFLEHTDVEMGGISINDFAVGAFYYGTTPNDGGSPIRILPGAIDDVRMYNRVLSADEIKGLMNGVEPAAPAVEAPVEEPAVEAPVEEPVVEEPAVEEPVVEEPKEEVVETPAVEEVVETPAVEEPAAPQTFDAAVIAAVSALVAAAGYAVSKKRR